MHASLFGTSRCLKNGFQHTCEDIRNCKIGDKSAKKKPSRHDPYKNKGVRAKEAAAPAAICHNLSHNPFSSVPMIHTCVCKNTHACTILSFLSL